MKKIIITILSFVLVVAPVMTTTSFAAAPVGTDTFELLATPYTGGDNTGDGGSGAAQDLNYFYVGQTFSTRIQIDSGGTTSSNIWVDYDSQKITASGLYSGTYFNVWSGQNIDASARGAGAGRIFSTGAEIPPVAQGGVGNFGTVNWTMAKPTVASYGYGAPTQLDINIGNIGDTTESNISIAGVDVLDDAEDFNFHIWADTVQPFSEDSSPLDNTVAVPVESNYIFKLRDTLNGDGDNSGVGTGVNISGGAITFNDGSGPVDYTSYDAYSCSGAWGTNLCNVTINPPSPRSITNDSRNWEYNKTYTVRISGFRDFASSSQNQLGDSNGPNTMVTKTYTFSTEGDTIAPEVVGESPSRGGSGTIFTNIVVDIDDRKTYPNGPSGVGFDPATCNISISSPTFAQTDYREGDSGVLVNATNYGYRFTIDPSSDFGDNETVSIGVSGCADIQSNVMITDNYSFRTFDTSSPYVDTFVPQNDSIINPEDSITFHIKDGGAGVDLTNTIIFVNGQYYSDGGGAGVITVADTRITYTNSYDFNGGNFAGDSTSVSGSSNNYTFILDHETNFTVGETVPVTIYSRDLDGNIMERVIYGVSLGGGVCTEGSVYCGGQTVWDGAQCIGSATTTIITSSPSSVESGLSLGISNVAVSQIDENSVIVSWISGANATAQVLYDTRSTSNYQNSTTEQDDNSSIHSVIIDGLSPGQVYYFVPVSRSGDLEAFGEEVAMTPRFATTTIERYISGDNEIVCPAPQIIIVEGEAPPAAVIVSPTTQIFELDQQVAPVIEIRETLFTLIKILDIFNKEETIVIDGIATPNSRVYVEIRRLRQ